MQEDQKIPEGNVHPDNSVLSKDSEFYQPEDNRTTREKLRTMNFKDKAVLMPWQMIRIVQTCRIFRRFR